MEMEKEKEKEEEKEQQPQQNYVEYNENNFYSLYSKFLNDITTMNENELNILKQVHNIWISDDNKFSNLIHHYIPDVLYCPSQELYDEMISIFVELNDVKKVEWLKSFNYHMSQSVSKQTKNQEPVEKQDQEKQDQEPDEKLEKQEVEKPEKKETKKRKYLNSDKSNQINCDCGGHYIKHTKLQHFKTTRHSEFILSKEMTTIKEPTTKEPPPIKEPTIEKPPTIKEPTIEEPRKKIEKKKRKLLDERPKKLTTTTTTKPMQEPKQEQQEDEEIIAWEQRVQEYHQKIIQFKNLEETIFELEKQMFVLKKELREFFDPC